MVLHRLEPRLDEGVVIAGSRPAVRDCNIELLQKGHQRNTFHRVTVISMERFEFYLASVQYPGKESSAVLFAFFFVNLSGPRPIDKKGLSLSWQPAVYAAERQRDFWMMSRNGFPINYSPLPVV